LESYGDFFQLPVIHLDTVNQKQTREMIEQLKVLPLSHFDRKLGLGEATQLLKKWNKPKILGSLQINKFLDHPLFALLSSAFLFIFWFLLTKYFLVDGLGQWLKSALFNTYLIGPLSEFNQPLLAPIATGVTIGLSYAVCFIAPLMFSFYFAMFFLKQSGLIYKIQRAVAPLLKQLGIPYQSFTWLFYGPSCHLTFLPQIKKLPPDSQTLVLFLTLAGIPCFSQSVVILNVLLAVHWGYGILFIGFILIQAIFATWILKKILRVPSHLYVQPYFDFVIPNLKNIFLTALNKTAQFSKNLLPYFLLASIILSLLDATGGLNILKSILNPFLYVLDLPEKTADFFVIGFFQREFGAAKLYYLTNQGELTALQALVSLILMTLFYPCFASLMLVIKHFGTRKAFKLALFTGCYAYLVALATSIVFRF
jgi:ferrous iron transport protein B